MITIPGFANKAQLYEYLRENKSLLIKAKKSEMKQADGVNCIIVDINQANGTVTKALGNPNILNSDKYSLNVVINATNYLDSHLDVHIPGIWKKSIKEQKDQSFLQEHIMRFDHVISDSVKAFTQMMSWKDLGYDYPGQCEALIFAVEAERKRNEFMAEQYANGWVRNHSVGMNYVQLFFCMNSESKWDVEEKDNWDKYYPQIVNQDTADDYGFFWSVTEAKCIEGSAVVRGSCPATPAISIEPSNDTQEIKSIEPHDALNCDKLIQAFTHKN